MSWSAATWLPARDERITVACAVLVLFVTAWLHDQPAAARGGLYQGRDVCAVITFDVIQTFELIFDVVYLVGLLLIVLPCLQTIG